MKVLDCIGFLGVIIISKDTVLVGTIVKKVSASIGYLMRVRVELENHSKQKLSFSFLVTVISFCFDSAYIFVLKVTGTFHTWWSMGSTTVYTFITQDSILQVVSSCPSSKHLTHFCIRWHYLVPWRNSMRKYSKIYFWNQQTATF